jgi:hypothetical protein
VVDSTKGQTILKFADPTRTSVVSVARLDAGDVIDRGRSAVHTGSLGDHVPDTDLAGVETRD